MSQKEFSLGDMVVLSTEEWRGICGVVSRPITEESKGHVLVHQDGYILGADVSADEVYLSDESTEGFAQLAYNLIKLSSRVIGQKLI